MKTSKFYTSGTCSVVKGPLVSSSRRFSSGKAAIPGGVIGI